MQYLSTHRQSLAQKLAPQVSQEISLTLFDSPFWLQQKVAQRASCRSGVLPSDLGTPKPIDLGCPEESQAVLKAFFRCSLYGASQSLVVSDHGHIM